MRGKKKKKTRKEQLLAILAPWVLNSLLSGVNSNRSNSQEGRVAPTFCKAFNGVCQARFVKLQSCSRSQGSYSWHQVSHPSAAVSHVLCIAEFTRDKENRLLKWVSGVGLQLGIQQRGKAQGHGWSMGRVAIKQGERKAQKAPMKVLGKFTVLIPNEQQTDVVIKAENLIVMYRDWVQKCWQLRNKCGGSRVGVQSCWVAALASRAGLLALSLP